MANGELCQLNAGIEAACWQYNNDAHGWGFLDVSTFRTRLWPLRTRYKEGDWTTDDRTFVQKLKKDGAGHALQNFFKHSDYINPVANHLLGEEPLSAEKFSKEMFIHIMRVLIKECMINNWGPYQFTDYINYLDNPGIAAYQIPVKSYIKNIYMLINGDFVRDYRNGGEGLQQCARDMLMKAADVAINIPTMDTIRYVHGKYINVPSISSAASNTVREKGAASNTVREKGTASNTVRERGAASNTVRERRAASNTVRERGAASNTVRERGAASNTVRERRAASNTVRERGATSNTVREREPRGMTANLSIEATTSHINVISENPQKMLEFQ